MSVNQFYLLLFGVSLFGGLSFVLLVEVCRLRNWCRALLDISNSHRDQICRLQGAEASLWSSVAEIRRKIEDLQAETSMHWECLATVSERLKLAESTAFFVVRRMPEAVSKPGEVHPFAADAFVTIEPEAAAA